MIDIEGPFISQNRLKGAGQNIVKIRGLLMDCQKSYPEDHAANYRF